MAPYHYVRLANADVTFLLRYALADGGLRGADRRYPGDADDAGSTRFVIHAWPVEEDTNIDVVVEPVLGDGTTDVNGDPIQDRPRRELFGRLEQLLSNFDNWALGRGLEGALYDPGWYAAGIVDVRQEEGDPWPWDQPTPDEFAPAGYGIALARITTEQAEQAGSGPGGGYYPGREIGGGRAAT